MKNGSFDLAKVRRTRPEAYEKWRLRLLFVTEDIDERKFVYAEELGRLGEEELRNLLCDFFPEGVTYKVTDLRQNEDETRD